MVDVLEYFPEDRSFLLDACCESKHEYPISVMPTLGRRELNAWFAASTGERFRQIITSDNYLTWTVDHGLALCDVEWWVAR